ncbi:NACHT domain-containing protein [Pseudomonas sp. StFLB209]|uniref:NACHT domain-containing protein n=1 Tax=Pseudomonas sp. StFLB209 TaxID=1028989 RepID=UPI0005EE6DD3|nr:NACHT domain-containing protein [Pseudomonas sp. StFLB209]
MKTFDIDGIKQTFENYGFEFRSEFSSNDLMIFAINQGIFDNAVILQRCDVSASTLKEELSELGYQVKIYKYISLKALEDELFNGFFSIARTKRNFKSDYHDHIRKITESFPESASEYSYISAPYVKNFIEHSPHEGLLEDINKELQISGPRLILLEAAAGYGKTCTAYEIGNMISDGSKEKIVLFAELSRDRKAKIFNHVLHKELARSFPAVETGLVLREIKNGKIIVILDGFDELLKERDEEENSFEKSQAMLETIGEILDSHAKVILTTRKTAILQGDEFDDWVSSHEKDFDFVRYSLREPEIKHWLTYERIEKLEAARINVRNLSNPVLLTFLKSVSDEEFENILESPDGIVDRYFSSLFMREIKRQDIKITATEQSDLLKRLAQHMMYHDYTRTSKESIISYFSHTESSLIEVSRSRYNAEMRPSYDEMVDRFSNHALLDRSTADNKIGFINDFVLGHFVALDVNTSNSSDWVAESIFIEAAVNAYSSRSLDSRQHIWSRLSEALKFMSTEERVRLELRLLDRVSGDVDSVQFNGFNFDTEDFFNEDEVSKCYFIDCTFIASNLNFDQIKNCVFLSCSFYNCTTTGANTSNEFVSCEHIGGDVICEATSEIKLEAENPEKTDTIKLIKSYILEKFWPIGNKGVPFAHRPIFFFYRGSPYPSMMTSKAIDELRKDGFLVAAKKKNWIGLDLTNPNFALVKEMLGR